jgi:hypothetical protein
MLHLKNLSIKTFCFIFMFSIVFAGSIKNVYADTTEYWAPSASVPINGPGTALLLDAAIGFGGYSGVITWTSPTTSVTIPDAYKIEFPGPALLPNEKVIGFRQSSSNTTGSFGFIAITINSGGTLLPLTYIQGNDVTGDNNIIGYDSSQGLIEARFNPVSLPIQAEMGVEFNATLDATGTFNDLEWLIQRTTTPPNNSNTTTEPNITPPTTPNPTVTKYNSVQKLPETGSNNLFIVLISSILLNVGFSGYLYFRPEK